MLRGSVVLHRLHEKNLDADQDSHALEDTIRIRRPTTTTSSTGLQCILEHADRLIDAGKKSGTKAQEVAP